MVTKMTKEESSHRFQRSINVNDETMIHIQGSNVEQISSLILMIPKLLESSEELLYFSKNGHFSKDNYTLEKCEAIISDIKQTYEVFQ